MPYNKPICLCLGMIPLVISCAATPKPAPSPVQTEVAPETTAETNSEEMPSAPVFPQEKFRATQPAATPLRNFQLPAVSQFRLGNQIEVYLVEQHELPTISMTMSFPGGSMTDRNGKEGTASLCMSMLSEGTQKLPKLEFEEALANTASNVWSGASAESQHISMTTLSGHFAETFALYADTITSPGFRREELARMQRLRLESLKNTKGSPTSVARRLLNNLRYGANHPFGKITTEKSLSRVNIRDCRALHRRSVRPQGAKLFVSGDITEGQLAEAFAPVLSNWKGRVKKHPKLPEPQQRSGRIFFVNIPGAAQSSIRLYHPGPSYRDKEYFANQLMASILGGGFASRINMNLREDKGYSYGARGNFGYTKDFGFFTAATSVRGDSTYQSLLELFAELEALHDKQKPVKAAELDREKNGSILGLPASFATPSQALNMYRNLVYYELPMDYFATYVDKYREVTLEQVANSAARVLRPEDAFILVVGDRSTHQIQRAGSNDVPMMVNNGKSPATLLDSLLKLAKSPIGGSGELVILNADGAVIDQ